MSRPLPEAADAGSEVARLNYPEIPESSEDPRDGAIKALVQKWRDDADIRSNGNAALAMMECADELEATLALRADPTGTNRTGDLKEASQEPNATH